MSSILKSGMPVWLSLVLACSASVRAAPPGRLEGHLKIYSPREVELADGGTPSKTVENYAEYPLIVMSGDGMKEVARVVADGDGNYRVALPPGDYVLDAQARTRGHLRAKPRPFKILSKETTNVDMEIDTGVR